MKTLLNNQTKLILEDLETNKLDDAWMNSQKLAKNSIINDDRFKNEFIIIHDGVLHLQNANTQIIHFFSKGDVINQQVSNLNLIEKLYLVCDTEVELTFINREYFFNFAVNKPSYLEWLLEMTLMNNLNLYNELIKYEFSTENKIVHTLQHLCIKLNTECQNNYLVVPPFINKYKLAKYSNISRTQLDKTLVSLNRKEMIKIENKTFHVIAPL